MYKDRFTHDKIDCSELHSIRIDLLMIRLIVQSYIVPKGSGRPTLCTAIRGDMITIGALSRHSIYL